MMLSISTSKFLVAETSSGDYNFHRWTCKPTDDYSLKSPTNLQATGTTHNNEKMQWYWNGTKNM